MAPDRPRPRRDWHLLVLAALVVLAALRLAVFVARSAVTPTYGFVAYYTAARLLLEGQPLDRAYHDTWFQAQIARFEPRANDIFRPNPPTTALLALPVAWLDHASARVVWLSLNAAALLAAGALLVRSLAWPAPWRLAFWAAAVSLQPVWANFAYGQVYLIVLLLTVCAWAAFQRARPGALGAALGGLLAFKLAGLLYWPLLALRRQWRAPAVALVVAAGVALLALPLTGWAAWPAHLSVLARLPADPRQTVTAYQALTSWARHLFLYDPHWNPAPWLAAPLLARTLPLLGGAALLLASLYAAWVAPDARLAFAAFTLLSLILSPLSLDYHFALALLPLALLADWLRAQPGRRWRWPWVAFALGVAAIGLPLPYQSARFEAGAWALLAYPKLYGSLLLWALAVWAQLIAARETAALPAHTPDLPVQACLLLW
ncbi:MAG: DUF2029 domain-containing protein [Anaerolineales bacterium]|nr:DUF2029 domain-containing protein [Anaerolineales bacterium]